MSIKLTIICISILLVVVTPAFATHPELDEFGKSKKMVAQEMVEQTILSFEDRPADTISMINNMDNLLFRDGSIYAFIVDLNGTIVAHGSTPDMVGTNLYDIENLEGLFAQASPHGWWIQYDWKNPTSSTYEVNLAWIKTKWGYNFGAGIYLNDIPKHDIELTEDDRERQRVAQHMVDEAIEAYATQPSLALSMIHDTNNPLFHDQELYVTIIHTNGTIIADGNYHTLIGADMEFIRDTTGVHLGDLFDANISLYGRWFEYNWPNPFSSESSALKVAWIKTLGEYMYTVGMYPEAPDEEYEDVLTQFDQDRMETAQMMLQNAITMFGTDMSLTIDVIHDKNNSLFHDEELYVVIADHTGDIVADGYTPDMVGQNLYNITDGYGLNLGELFETSTYYGKWIEYNWPNPDAGGAVQEKKTLLINRGGYTFSVGIYPGYKEPYDELTQHEVDRRHLAQSMVEHTISSFTMNPTLTINTIHDGTNELYNDNELYVTITHVNGTVIAHGQSPDLVGDDMESVKDGRGVSLGDLYDDNQSIYGKWVEYHWPNPTIPGSNDESYLAWFKTNSDYIFTSGIYPEYDD
ncbi:MAG: hypothetical protein F4Y18_06330 [Cenarchaeum sp. SB0663_bin_5]|nr:hypothetical protein [Cenarchaeum sp. SB0663_bin_5]MYH03418.1 hypothetical protein [Cenarchaeum sp. SB0675_bin_21]